ncbi:MAG: TIGR03663 family protein [Chloroflexi bacterium]|nr:TIGR03663 family protein [Chloroflexota bacterium]
MSIERPPGRQQRSDRPPPAPAEPDYDALDLTPGAPPENGLDGGDEHFEPAGASGPTGQKRLPRAARGATALRAGAASDPQVDLGTGGAARPVTPVRAVDGAAGIRPAPAAARSTPPVEATPAALHEDEPSLGEWLSRRWLFGLTYWQAALLGLLAVALVLTRFFELGVRAMHHDESMHAKFAWDSFHGQLYKYNPLLHGPFQFLSVAGSFWLFGATEWTARAVPAAFGVALVALTFFWRRWLGAAGWLFAIGIFVFSPSFTYYARMLREDSYTATWTLLAATGLVGYILHRGRPWYYAFCAGLAFAFATKESTYITAFIFGTFMILSLLWETGGPARRRLVAGGAAGAVVGAYLSSVVGLYKKELFEAGGAALGLLVGLAFSFAYHQIRVARTRAGAGGAAGPARLRHRRGFAGLHGGAGAGQDNQPDGKFTRALVTLWQDKDGFWGVGTFWGGVVVFFLIFIVIFSSLFTNPAGIREGMIGSIRYWLEQHGVQRGNQPWFYYPIILSVYETLAWVFTLVATAYYLRKPTWLTSFLIWWWVVALVIYSWAGEKMPWLIIHIATPMVLLSARYLGELATSAFRGIWEKRLAFGAVAVLGIWTIHTGWPVNFERPDTPKDLLVYTQTAPDVKKVMRDIERISLEQTGDARTIGVTVQSGTWWPFSWYLRDFKNVDYPSQLTAPATKPIVLIALEDDEKNRPFLQGYTRTRYKMRWWYPEDYRSLKPSSFVDFFTKKDVRDGLWKWLIYRETTQPLGSYDFYAYLKEGLGPTIAGSGESGGEPAVQAPAPRINAEQYAAKTVALTPIVQWGSAGRNPGQLNTPRGVTLDAQGNVFVADTLNHRIQKFDRTGKLITAWGTEGSGDGQFKEPMGLAVDGQGNVFVADTWNHRIQKFDGNGKFLAKWAGQGGFWGPRGVALDDQGNVFVTDTGNKRIQKFDGNGRFIAQFGTGGSGPGQLNEPIGVAVSAAGDVFVADTNNRRVQHFDNAGKLIGEWPLAGWQGGLRNEPYIALDAAGDVYVTDPPNGRIVKFGPTGEVLAVGGGTGSGPTHMSLPLGIAAGDAIYVADSANNRIVAFAPLQ